MDLVVPFDTDDPEFVRGFEVGTLWERVKSELPCTVTIHAANAEMAIRVAEAAHVAFSAEDLGDEWLAVTFHESRS